MSLNREAINPLSGLGLRKLKYIPEHFAKVNISKTIDIDLLDHWINFNLNSRYAIAKGYKIDQNNKMVEITEVGIEDPKELALLSLGYLFLQEKEIK